MKTKFKVYTITPLLISKSLIHCLNFYKLTKKQQEMFMETDELFFLICFVSFIFISWRLITLQYCSGFCHTFT